MRGKPLQKTIHVIVYYRKIQGEIYETHGCHTHTYRVFGRSIKANACVNRSIAEIYENNAYGDEIIITNAQYKEI